MKNLTFWRVFRYGGTYQGDPPRIHARTKEELLKKMKELPYAEFSEPEQLTADFVDDFDLMEKSFYQQFRVKDDSLQTSDLP